MFQIKVNPWLLSCEQMFRAARSMTSTFSMVINFSMGWLHCLHIQTWLESEAEETGICYSRVLAHVKEVGFSDESSIDTVNVQKITNESIAEC